MPPLRCACEAGKPSQRYGHSQRVKVREGGERERKRERRDVCAWGKYGEIQAGRDKNTGYINARTFIDLRSYIVPSAAAPTRILHTGNGHHKHPAHTLSLSGSPLSP